MQQEKTEKKQRKIKHYIDNKQENKNHMRFLFFRIKQGIDNKLKKIKHDYFFFFHFINYKARKNIEGNNNKL